MSFQNEALISQASIACIYVNHDSVNLIGDSKQRYPLCVGSNFKWALCIIFSEMPDSRSTFLAIAFGSITKCILPCSVRHLAVVIHIH